jgi:hypothetical protein
MHFDVFFGGSAGGREFFGFYLGFYSSRPILQNLFSVAKFLGCFVWHHPADGFVVLKE